MNIEDIVLEVARVLATAALSTLAKAAASDAMKQLRKRLRKKPRR